jgi:hypothetical protein
MWWRRVFGEQGMPDQLLDAINVLWSSAWVWIPVVVVILIAALAFLTTAIPASRKSRKGHLSREELRLLRAFNEQAQGDPRAYLSVEFAAYKAGLQSYDEEVRRLKDLGYLEDSHIESYLRYRPVWITPEGMRRATKRW